MGKKKLTFFGEIFLIYQENTYIKWTKKLPKHNKNLEKKHSETTTFIHTFSATYHILVSFIKVGGSQNIFELYKEVHN